MKAKDIGEKFKGLSKYKYLILVLLVGVVLILLPTGSSGADDKVNAATDIEAPVFSLEEQEKRLAQLLESIEGAGKVEVMLSLKGGVERELAVVNSEALVVSAGSGIQDAVEVRYVYPEYLGAVIVCQGGLNPKVKLDVTKAVQSVTGLGSDKITVIKMK